TNYLPYQSDTLVSESTTATNGTSSTATFAAKVDYNKPAGLYSIAFDLKTIPIVTQTYMQNMDPNICRADSPTIVIDSRDEQPYLIQRLDDGKCWMLDNLNLDLTNKTIVDNLTTANTNADANSLRSLKEGYRDQCVLDGGSDCNKYATSGLALSNWVEGASATIPMASISGKCDPELNSTEPCIPNNVVYTRNTIASNSNWGLGSNKIGVYYNYCAASAGSFCYDIKSDSGAPLDGTNIDYDICPIDWKLPSVSDLGALCKAVNGNNDCGASVHMAATDSNSLQYKLSMPLSGRYDNGTAWEQGKSGYVWASTTSNYAAANGLNINNGIVSPGSGGHNRFRGRSVRCVSS
ncbi:hypothetical protein IKF23_02080, partial [Candidatus Saccharibacteria bacterium]|nr:hypothetical protein [Candidatus Saccharibacteria bacterium]